MRKALPILQKDVRRLRLELAVWLLLLGVHGWMEAALPARLTFFGLAGVWEVLLVAGAWYLVVAVIHEDRLPGDRQAWLTTPIPRRSLFLAKLLFAVIFLNVPLVLSQVIGLLANGLAPSDYVRMVIWQQIVCTSLFVAPAAALAAVTANLRQFLTALLAGCGGALLLGLGVATLIQAPDLPWGGVAWVLSAAVAILAPLIAATVLSLAYLRRKIRLARLVLGGGILLCGLLPALDLWPVAFRLQKRLSPRPSEAANLSLSLEAARKPAAGLNIVVPSSSNPVRLAIPVAIKGIPADAELACERVRTSIVAEGVSWDSGWRTGAGFLRREGQWWERLEIDRTAFERMRNLDVHLHARAAWTMFGPPSATRIPIPSVNRYIPNVGFCWAFPNFVQCLAPFRHAARVEMRSRSCNTGDATSIGIQPEVSYAPYAAGLGFSLWRTDIGGFMLKGITDCELIVESREPVAYFERDLDIPSIRLSAYAETPGGQRR
jgi:hypothetical protein